MLAERSLREGVPFAAAWRTVDRWALPVMGAFFGTIGAVVFIALRIIYGDLYDELVGLAFLCALVATPAWLWIVRHLRRRRLTGVTLWMPETPVGQGGIVTVRVQIDHDDDLVVGVVCERMIDERLGSERRPRFRINRVSIETTPAPRDVSHHEFRIAPDHPLSGTTTADGLLGTRTTHRSAIVVMPAAAVDRPPMSQHERLDATLHVGGV